MKKQYLVPETDAIMLVSEQKILENSRDMRVTTQLDPDDFE